LPESTEPPSISVVTPVFNAAATIEETLRSVREQDYDNVEHVVVDGGSTDGTVEILRHSEGVRWISEPDEGRPDAVNKGVRMSMGEVVGFLNADDTYESGTLRTIGEVFAHDPQAMWATGYCRIIDGSGDEIRAPITSYKNVLLRHFSFPLYLTQNFVSDPATFVRRAALDEVGPLDNRYRISHDYELWLRVARRWDPIVVRRNLSSFRMVEGTLSMAGFEQQFREHEEVARLHGDGHRLPVLANALMSRLIVASYRLMRLRRRHSRALRQARP
jgi:glycosyltransferase involved in cell wall biosynthesis